MKSPKNFALILLALTSLGGAGLAWQQYQELSALRVATLDKAPDGAMQKRLANLERMNRELQDQLDAARDNAAGDRPAAMPGNGQPGRGGFQGGRGGRGDNPQFQQQLAARQALMAKPEVQALLAIQMKARLEATYGNLFKNLNLTPEQMSKVDSLLADRRNTREDVLAAARDQGIDPRANREAFDKLMADSQASVNNDLKSVLGDAGFAQLQNYEQTMPERNLVNQLQQRLSSSDAPLTSAQAEQLVQILAANAPAGPQRGDGFGPPPVTSAVAAPAVLPAVAPVDAAAVSTPAAVARRLRSQPRPSTRRKASSPPTSWPRSWKSSSSSRPSNSFGRSSVARVAAGMPIPLAAAAVAAVVAAEFLTDWRPRSGPIAAGTRPAIDAQVFAKSAQRKPLPGLSPKGKLTFRFLPP